MVVLDWIGCHRVYMRTLLAPIRPELWAIIVFSTVINALIMVVPLYTMHLYDKVLPSHSLPTLVSLTVAAVLLISGMGILDGLRSRVQIRAASEVDAHLASRVFEVAMARLARSPGDGSVQSFTDIKELRTFLIGPALPAFVDAPWAALFLGVVFLLHPLMGAVSLAGAATLIGLAMLSDARTRQRLAEGSSLGTQAETFVNSCIRSAEAVTALGMLPGVQRVWREKVEASLVRVEAATETAASVMSSAKAVRQSLQMLIMAVGAWLVLKQEMGPGTMFAAAMMVSRALSPVEQALGAWRGFVSARQASVRLTRLLAHEPPAPPIAPPLRPDATLVLSRVTAPVPGGSTPFLHAIDIGATGGEIVGIVGPSGAGKSVLGRVIVGLIRPLAGEVRLGGLDMVTTPADCRGRFVGYLPQDLQLVDGTVREIVSRFEPVPDEKAILRAARLAGVHDLIIHLPQGYDTRLGGSRVVLSGGQRQRIALARALYGDPPLVVLDEPDASLDAEANAALQRCLRRLKDDGRVVVVISHRPNLVALTDRIIELVGGRVLVQGPREQALAQIRARVRGERQGEQAGATA